MKSYTRPEPRPLELKLKDILEDEVEERYYLTDEQVASNRNQQHATLQAGRQLDRRELPRGNLQGNRVE